LCSRQLCVAKMTSFKIFSCVLCSYSWRIARLITKLLSDHYRILNHRCLSHGPSEGQANLTNVSLRCVKQYRNSRFSNKMNMWRKRWWLSEHLASCSCLVITTDLSEFHHSITEKFFQCVLFGAVPSELKSLGSLVQSQ
jgi:hypothetical protein